MGLLGSRLAVSGVYPDLDTRTSDPKIVVPSKGPIDFQLARSGEILENWGITEYQIRIDFTKTITYSSGEFDYNAWVIQDVRDTLPNFSNVKIVSAKTTANWESSMIEWTENTIIINYIEDSMGVHIESGDKLILRVTFDLTSGSNRNDQIVGTAGADKLFGKRGKDDIDGNRGADIINGGRGDDALNGGRGADKFVFKAQSGFDIIEDFQDKKDKIVLRDWDATRFKQLEVSESGASVTISDGENTIKLLNSELSEIGAFDFYFL